MHEIGETWDVFVVGQRDSSHASTVMLAAELSHYTGMPTSEVELALMKGEVRVRAGLERAVAEGAAMELDDIGAIIDLRLSDGKSGAFPILKPDAMRRSGVAVGGFIDDSATPPEVADNSGLNRLPLEPDQESPPPPPPPMGTPLRTLEDIASEPIRIGRSGPEFEQPGLALGHVDDHADKAVFDPTSARRPDSVPPLMNRASAAPNWTTEPAPPQPAAPGYAPVAAPAHPAHAVPAGPGYQPPVAAPQPAYAPAPQAPAPAPQAPAPAGPDPADSASLMAGLDKLEVSELPTAPKTKKKKKKKKKSPTPLPPQMAEAAKERRSGPAPSESLELDFEAVGITPKNRRLRELGGRISGEHKPIGGEPPRRTRAGNMAGTGGAAVGVHGFGERAFILGRDVYTAMPLGLAIGLLMSLMVAIQLQRGAGEETLVPLEEELRIATTSASLVDAGEVRPPAKVEALLQSESAGLKQSFIIKWLAIGLPLGLALGRIRKPE